MKVLIKSQVFFSLLALTAMAVMGACSSPSKPAISPQPQVPAAAPETIAAAPTLPPATEPAITAPPPILPATRVEVVYFHMPQRCVTCLCFEERVDYVIKTYFQNELASGKLTFAICNLADREKAPLFRKYDAFASQLFINTIVNNTDNIKNIEDIWKWRCVADKKGFDEKVRSIIAQSLEKAK